MTKQKVLLYFHNLKKPVILKHYLNFLSSFKKTKHKLKLIINAALLNPDRFIAIFALFIGIFFICKEIPSILNTTELYKSILELNYIKENKLLYKILENFEAITVDTYELIIWFMLWFMFFATFPINFFITRKDADDFAKVLSTSSSVDELIRDVAFEAYYIIFKINSNLITKSNDSESSYKKISKLHRNVQIYRKSIYNLASRLQCDSKDLYNDIFHFDVQVYLNRQRKLVEINRQIFDIERELDRRYSDFKDELSALRKTDQLIEGLKALKINLNALKEIKNKPEQFKELKINLLPLNEEEVNSIHIKGFSKRLENLREVINEILGFMELKSKLEIGKKLIEQSSIRRASHLCNLIETKMNLGKLEPIFLSRSITSSTENFIRLLEDYVVNDMPYVSPKMSSGKLRKNTRQIEKDIKTLIEVVTAHRTGAIIHRALGLALIAYENKISLHETFNQDDASYFSEKHFKIRLELLTSNLKLRSNLSIENLKEAIHSWPHETNFIILSTRNEVINKFDEYLSKIVAKEHGKNIKIIIHDYSRIILSILRESILRNVNFDDNILKKINIMVLMNEDKDHDFGSRLSYYSLKFESEDLDDLRVNLDSKKLKRYETFEKSIWRGELSNFQSTLTPDDKVLYLTGCDTITQINFNRNTQNNPPECTALLRKKLPSYEDIYGSIKEPSKRDKVDILIFSGIYKLDVEYLYQSERCTKYFSENSSSNKSNAIPDRYKPKNRRSNLFQWQTNEDFDVRLIANNINIETYKENELF